MEAARSPTNIVTGPINVKVDESLENIMRGLRSMTPLSKVIEERAAEIESNSNMDKFSGTIDLGIIEELKKRRLEDRRNREKSTDETH